MASSGGATEWNGDLTGSTLGVGMSSASCMQNSTKFKFQLELGGVLEMKVPGHLTLPRLTEASDIGRRYAPLFSNLNTECASHLWLCITANSQKLTYLRLSGLHLVFYMILDLWIAGTMHSGTSPEGVS
ncbi:hypothetical protein BJ912DRAFT_925496 [Pholiota molesta]|nr:hypothetical protein BJ912DRAFT_925496 [Pholiota molesta]